MESKRIFKIGEEWLYFKIYIRSYFADKILIKLLDFLSPKLSSGEIGKWFFIRYYDPDFHLRVRVLISDYNETAKFIHEINSLLEKEVKDRIASITMDMYVRELERYDPLCIELMEELFFYDTVTVIPILKQIEEEHLSEDERWLYGLIALDKTLSDFELNMIEKLQFVSNINSVFSLEFQKDKTLNKQLDKVYREYEGIIVENVNGDPFSEILSTTFVNKKRVISELLKKNRTKELTQSIENIMSSYIHMNCNRLFRVEQRKQEYILYDFLTRFYKKEVYKKG